MNSFYGIPVIDTPLGWTIHHKMKKSSKTEADSLLFYYFGLPPTDLNPACDRLVCFTKEFLF